MKPLTTYIQSLRILSPVDALKAMGSMVGQITGHKKQNPRKSIQKSKPQQRPDMKSKMEDSSTTKTRKLPIEGNQHKSAVGIPVVKNPASGWDYEIQFPEWLASLLTAPFRWLKRSLARLTALRVVSWIAEKGFMPLLANIIMLL